MWHALTGWELHRWVRHHTGAVWSPTERFWFLSSYSLLPVEFIWEKRCSNQLFGKMRSWGSPHSIQLVCTPNFVLNVSCREDWWKNHSGGKWGADENDEPAVVTPFPKSPCIRRECLKSLLTLILCCPSSVYSCRPHPSVTQLSSDACCTSEYLTVHLDRVERRKKLNRFVPESQVYQKEPRAAISSHWIMLP